MDQVFQLALQYGQGKLTEAGIAWAMEKLGLDKQTENPQYAISLGGNTFDLGSMAKKAGLNQGIKSIMGGKLSGIMGPAAFLGGALMLGRAFNPLNPKARNYNPNLAQEIDFATNKGYITKDPGTGLGKYGLESVLAGQNVASMFGTNSYLGQLENKKDYFEDRKAKGKNYNESKYAQTLDEIREAKGFTRDKNKTKDYGPFTQDNKTGGGQQKGGGGGGWGTYCFDPNTFVQMADGSEKKIKEIQLGDNTKGGEVTGVFQFKASDEIHDYKGVTVAGSHYVKEDGRFIMVKDSPLAIKIDKIPVVYSLDTTDKRIFIKDIEFADYNGDGVAKGFLANAGINVPEFNKEVLRQVEQRLI